MIIVRFIALFVVGLQILTTGALVPPTVIVDYTAATGAAELLCPEFFSGTSGETPSGLPVDGRCAVVFRLVSTPSISADSSSSPVVLPYLCSQCAG